MDARIQLRKCCETRPWGDADPQYVGGQVSEIFVYYECPDCRVRTKSYYDEFDAIRDWNAGIVFPWSVVATS